MSKQCFTAYIKGKIKLLLLILFLFAIFMLNATQHGQNFKEKTVNTFNKTAISKGFILNNVDIKGRINTPKQEILNIVSSSYKKSIFSVDINKINKKISAIGWVDKVSVERRFPNTLFITIKEKKPVAIWQLHGALHIIDKNGDKLSSNQLQKFSHLKILVGEGANTQVLDFLRIIAHDITLSKIVTAGVWVSKRRWNILLLNQIEVKLPATTAYESWAKLAKYAKEKNLLTRNIKSIDLRIPDKFFLRMNTNKKNKDSKT